MKITICGSMVFVDQMNLLKADLEKIGHEVISPQVISGGVPFRRLVENRGGIAKLDKDDPIWQLKANAIDDHFKKIAWCDAVLIANYDKNEMAGYVGGNTLMEIAVARFLGKRILVLKEIDNGLNYKEEILGCLPIILGEDLSSIDT
ncbi:hypothetical protein KC644_01390 [Candidatus Berkelbacteria bacterium]|nr:hypothetical protein [Candidatus Berkelbacteria bacterium]